uniref:Uncharacterized protein n=1 Tax=Arundo donax TaxID=35708 RepID=A0A0A9G438_ARUDO
MRVVCRSQPAYILDLSYIGLVL